MGIQLCSTPIEHGTLFTNFKFSVISADKSSSSLAGICRMSARICILKPAWMHSIISYLNLYALAQLIGLAHQPSARFHTARFVTLTAAEHAAQLDAFKTVYPPLDAVHGARRGVFVLSA